MTPEATDAATGGTNAEATPRPFLEPGEDIFAAVGRRLAPWGACIGLAIVFVVSVLHYYELGYGSLMPWDESMYALRAKFVLRGEILDQYPHCYGNLGRSGFYSGAFPPVLVWAMAICMKLFGVTTFAVRLPAALAGTGAVWVMYLWGRDSWDRLTGVFAAFTLASWFFFMTFARRGQFDVPVAFFMLLTVYLGARYYREGRLRWIVLAGVAMGFGLMTKILIAGFVAVALLLYGLARWARGDWRFGRLVLDQVVLNAVGVGLALPWHLFMVLKYQTENGNLFLDYWWGFHVWRRSEEVIDMHHSEYHYYFWLLQDRLGGVWCFLLAIAVLWAIGAVAWWLIDGIRTRRERVSEWKTRREAGEKPELPWSEEHAVAVALFWLLFVFCLTLMTTTKRKVYAFPFLPPLAMIGARFAVKAWRGEFPHWVSTLFAFGAALFMITSRSKSDVEDATTALVEGATLFAKIAGAAGYLWPIVLGAVGIAIVLELIARFAPRLERLPVFAALVVFAIVGIDKGMERNFDRSHMNESDWSPVDEAVRKQDFNKVVFIGYRYEPDLTYYLNGIDKWWHEDIEYENIVHPGNWRRAPIPPDPGTLVILQDAMVQVWQWPRQDLERMLELYELETDGEHFDIYRARTRG